MFLVVNGSLCGPPSRLRLSQYQGNQSGELVAWELSLLTGVCQLGESLGTFVRAFALPSSDCGASSRHLASVSVERTATYPSHPIQHRAR